MSYPRMDAPQPLTPIDMHQQLPSPPNTMQPIHSSLPRPSPPAVIQAQAAATVDLLHFYTVRPFQDHCCKLFFSESTESCKDNYSAECVNKSKNKTHYTVPSPGNVKK